MNPVRRNLLILTTALVLGFLFVVGLFFSAPRSVSVIIAVSPADSALTVDGKNTKPGAVTLSTGTHVLRVTRQYFTPTTKTVNTKDLKKGQTITMLPGADSDQARQYLIDHPNDAQQREAAGAAAAAAAQDTLSTNYPIIGSLPYQTLDFKIDYTLDAQNHHISFLVTLYPIHDKASDPQDYNNELNLYKNEALNWLQSQNINTNTAKISFSPSN